MRAALGGRGAHAFHEGSALATSSPLRPRLLTASLTPWGRTSAREFGRRASSQAGAGLIAETAFYSAAASSLLCVSPLL